MHPSMSPPIPPDQLVMGRPESTVRPVSDAKVHVYVGLLAGGAGAGAGTEMSRKERIPRDDAIWSTASPGLDHGSGPYQGPGGSLRNDDAGRTNGGGGGVRFHLAG